MAGATVMAPDRAAQLSRAAEEMAAEFHTANPLRPGIPKASLASRLGLEPEALGAVLATSSRLEERGSSVAVEGFEATLGADLESE